MSFVKWKARLAGEKVAAFTSPDSEDEGYYRLPITRKKPNGQTETLGYKPCAYFLKDGKLVGTVERRWMTPNEMDDYWTWCVRHPISYDVYKAVIDGAEWPDKQIPPEQLVQADAIPAANREVSKSDNLPPDEPELPLDQQHRQKIRTAIDALADIKIVSEEDAARAEGAKNRIAELRLDADKAGKAIYQPMYREYKAEQEKWSPIVTLAETAEARLKAIILTFRENERKRIAAEAAKIADNNRLAEEAAERAADRAIASGQPETAPIVEQPKAAPVAAKPTATYGKRTVRQELKKFVTIEDQAQVYEFFKTDPQLIAVLQKLSDEAVKAGTTVPGTTVEERLI